eukprot:TRINITY_DN5339_c0_g1_i2.p2 TRINITY_DN5339_c0_g1~~TRINITY_DN5339_c0_g1_i2.p2  ORF type:complete len:277 (+),score=72.30 TRINITY_DN5339_c0_g1_i2:254-1084(+)
MQASDSTRYQKWIKKLVDIKRKVSPRSDTLFVAVSSPSFLRDTKFATIFDLRSPFDVRYIDFNSNNPIKPLFPNYEHKLTVGKNEILGKPIRHTFAGPKLTRKRLGEFLRECQSGKLPQTYENEESFHYQKVPALSGLDFDQMAKETLKKNRIVVLWKPKCGACFIARQSFEALEVTLRKIRSEIEEIERTGVQLKGFEDKLLNKYHIRHREKFKDVELFRYNIYNESQEFPSPSLTPLFLLFKKENPLKPELLDISGQNQDKMIRAFIRFIDEKL